MKEKKYRMVVDKKNILLADEKLDITKDIMSLLNKKLKSIKFKLNLNEFKFFFLKKKNLKLKKFFQKLKN